MRKLRSSWRSWISLLALLAPLAACSFIERANYFRARGRIDLTAPISWIPGVDSLLPHIVLDLTAGFEWSSEEDRHRYDLEKRNFLPQKEDRDEIDLEDLFLDRLSSSSPPSELRDR